MMNLSTLRALVSLTNDAAILDELNSEIAKAEKAEQRKADAKAVKAAEYAEAHDVVMGVIADATGAISVAEIFDACKDELPEGFTKNKISYALRNYWASEVVKTEGKVNAYTKA